MPGATVDSFQRSVGFQNNSLAHAAPVDIEGHLLAEEEVDQVFMSARNLKCFRWQDSSFEIDPDVKTVQDVINYSRVSPPCVALGGF